MPSRRKPSYHVEAEVTPSAPANLLSVLGSNLPATFIVSAVVGLAVWYATVNSEQKRAGDDISKLNTKLEEVSRSTVATTKEQDERRAAMAKEFLASNKEIATKVGDLATVLAVQQATQKATSDALAKISDQLQQLNATKRH